MEQYELDRMQEALFEAGAKACKLQTEVARLTAENANLRSELLNVYRAVVPIAQFLPQMCSALRQETDVSGGHKVYSSTSVDTSQP